MREIPPNVKKPADAAAVRAYLVVGAVFVALAVIVFLIANAGRHAAV